MSRIENLSVAMKSANLETRILALEQAAAEDAETYAKAAVLQIADFPEDGYFVLERIGRFGTAVVPHLRALETVTQDATIRLLCTLALADFNVPLNIEMLFRAIHERSEYENLACRALASLDVRSSVPWLVEEMAKTEVTAEWRLVSLVDAIRRLGGVIPSEEIRRLSQPNVSSSVRNFFEREGPG
jgi:hypothetical protein